MDNFTKGLEDVFCKNHPGLREAAQARDMSVLQYVFEAIRNQISDDASMGRVSPEMSRKIKKFIDEWKPRDE